MIAVIFGAFFAHTLKDSLTEYDLSIFDKASQYHFIHTLASIAALLLFEKFNTKKLLYASLFFLLGIFFFSGSLYLLAIKDFLHLENWKFLGPITPIGGICFITGWIFLILFSYKQE